MNAGTTVTVKIRRGTAASAGRAGGVPRRTGLLAAAAPYIEEVSGWVGDTALISGGGNLGIDGGGTFVLSHANTYGSTTIYSGTAWLTT